MSQTRDQAAAMIDVAQARAAAQLEVMHGQRHSHICKAVIERLGLENRLGVQYGRDGSMRIYLDGRPLIAFGPLVTKAENGQIEISQTVERLDG